ncbi:MAG: serpin family protein [Candidatus Cloacimonetes bacterium]|nr:serpin family protein [Candidatus Cloacimonadota bacterium]MCB5287821.1 serpin family protein [Candidatus Cloacimonadota bacterium]MCK9185560.1 serpin family protein [Candidatus Cloacimonadota bacterium]MDY0230142.1 serpin family protein [Candidatus Cloacimonadaceae bacterium]
MHKYLITIIAVGLILLSSACCKNKSAQVQEADHYPALDHEISSAELSQQNNAFAFGLWQEVENKGENLLFSPYSINSAMGLAYTGAKGNTANEMGKVMGYPYSPDQQHLTFAKSRKVLAAVQARKRAELQIANAMFSADTNKARIVPQFTQTLKSSFGSELFLLDFSKAKQSADFINAWVEKQTNERIKDIVSERQIAQSNDGLVLVNSIYFKSAWLSPFSRKSTHEEKFYTSSQREDGSWVLVPMMQQKGEFYYAELPEGQLIELPFEDEELAMVFMLPQDIDKVCQDLNQETWQSWMKQLSEVQKVELFLPRFCLEQTLDTLPDTFKALGMRAAFEAGSADFSGILSPGSDKLYISDIVHKAFLEVLEEGTEAAAATQIGFAKTSLEPPVSNMPVFRADKPFLCMIIHKADNNILFMGKVQKPEPAEAE